VATGFLLTVFVLLQMVLAVGPFQRTLRALGPWAEGAPGFLAEAASVALGGCAGYRALRSLVAGGATARARLLELAHRVLLPTVAVVGAFLIVDRSVRLLMLLLAAVLLYELALGLPAALREPEPPPHAPAALQVLER